MTEPREDDALLPPLGAMLQPPASAVMYRIGGREYPARTAPNCRVCGSESRVRIERAILAGLPYAAIARGLPDEVEVSAHNIASHYRNGHMPLEQSGVRAVVEERAAAVGADLMDGVAAFADHVSLASTVVQLTAQGIAAGTLGVRVRDGIQAARLLAQVEIAAGEGAADQALYTEAFLVIQDAAEQVMTTDQFAEFGRMLMSNEKLRDLRERASRRHELSA